jgi:hypothetical protein
MAEGENCDGGDHQSQVATPKKFANNQLNCIVLATELCLLSYG